MRTAMRHLRKVLIANRGEVALRIVRACRSMGVATVAVYSDADRQALHVAQADEAIYLGGSRAAESYLDAERLCRAVRVTGADAVHPGFGFLAENADFAERVRAAGATFIGPPPSAIRLMGSKPAARQFVRGLGIPTVPGDDEADQCGTRLAESAIGIGYPVMIKAAAGGGGSGIRVVHDAGDFAAQLAAARTEAMSAFGDPRLLLEKYFAAVRHVEVQLIADHHGAVLHLFDRECSIQRRRQKVIEEAPASLVIGRLRQLMSDAAVRIARTAGYASLGTVEFLVDEASQQFFFLEMNTRLQVEHGITEMITGLDLVRMQIEVAEGRPLALRQDDVHAQGHAIECRLYAEDPQEGFAPSAGRILHWRVDTGPDARVDSCIEPGTDVTTFYDPMLAKIMARGPDRATALRRVRQAVARTQVAGIPTNQRFLLRTLDHPLFDSGRVTTRFVDQHGAELTAPPDEPDVLRSALVATLQRLRHQSQAAMSVAPERSFRVLVESQTVTVAIRSQGDARFLGTIGTRDFQLEILRSDDEQTLLVAIDGQALQHAVIASDNITHVTTPGVGTLRVEFLSRFWRSLAADSAGHYRAPMTGRILEVLVQPGTRVQARDRLVIMESMKMEHTTVAGEDGVVTAILVSTGDIVEKGMLLAEVEAAPVAPLVPGG
jgi:acetyl/propionyl-CoA carboxylase alpha subunit